MTKMLIAAVALATVITAPAFAQSTTTRRAPHATRMQVAPNNTPADAQRRAANPANDVHPERQYGGADPDPDVRLNLRRDYESHD